jgi:hypothetical protein
MRVQQGTKKYVWARKDLILGEFAMSLFHTSS